MPTLTIPERYKSGLASLLTISPEAFEELLSALKRAPACAGNKELAAWVAPEVKSIPADDASKIVITFTSLYRVRVRSEVPAARLAQDVMGAMQQSGREDLRVPNDATASVLDRITKLLELKTLNVLETKASELQSEFPHVMCDPPRVFTDLRPVFGGDVADSPATMLIVYTLKFGYHDAHEGKHREFFLSLDSDDLITLKDVIARAETKVKTLKSQLEDKGIRAIDLANPVVTRQ